MMYERQQNPAPAHTLDLAFVGTGGVGSWTAIYTALSGIARSMFLVDGDTLEDSNLNRLPYTREQLGSYKVDALYDFIHNRRPDQFALPVPTYMDEDLAPSFHFSGQNFELDGVIFGAEGREANRMIVEAFPELHEQNRIIFVGCDEDHFSIRTKPVGMQLVSDEAFHYDDVWVGSASGAGLFATMAIRQRLIEDEPIPDKANINLRYFDWLPRLNELEDEIEARDEKIETLEEAREELKQERLSNRLLRQQLSNALFEIEKLVAENAAQGTDNDTAELLDELQSFGPDPDELEGDE